MLGLFAVCAVGQVLAGWFDFNQTATSHGEPAIPLGAYVTRGHLWEALFENWESEFLQMSAFVVLSAYLYQVGSPESRRPGAHELVDADPRAFARSARRAVGGAARRLGAAPLRVLAGRRALPAVPGVVRRPSPRRLGRAERRAAAARRRRRARCSTTRRRAASGSSRCRTGRASSCRSARWCGWRSTCGSAGHRNRNRCTPRTPRPAADGCQARLSGPASGSRRKNPARNGASTLAFTMCVWPGSTWCAAPGSPRRAPRCRCASRPGSCRRR